MSDPVVSLLDFDWRAAADPDTYSESVRKAFGSGAAPAGLVAQHLMPPMRVLESAQIEITTWCNFKCQQCERTKEITAGRWNNAHIPMDRFKRIVDKLPRTRQIYLQGVGEPSMHPDFVAMLTLVSDSGKFDSIHFNTNAHTHDDAWWQSLAGFHGITVGLSVDSLDPDVAELCRAGTDAELLWGRLKLFRDTFKWFIVALVASRLNLHDIERTLRKIAALGKVPVQITPCMSDDASVVLDQGDKTWLAARLAEIRKDYPDFSVFFNANNSGFSPNEKRCVSPFLSPYFAVDGHLAPCCNATSPRHYTGVRADDDRDWDAIRSDERVTTWVRAFIDADPEVCIGCSLNPNQQSLIKKA